MTKKSFSSQNYFFEAEISYESQGVALDQMKVSERRTDPKKTEMKFFPLSIKKTH